MKMMNWKQRLETLIEASGRSQREISLAAGRNPGYVNSVINEEKDATIGHLIAVCRAANISIYNVLGGFDITPDTEEFLRLLHSTDEKTQESVLHLLQQARRP